MKIGVHIFKLLPKKLYLLTFVFTFQTILNVFILTNLKRKSIDLFVPLIVNMSKIKIK